MKLADWIGFLCLIIALIVLWQFRQILLLLFFSVVLATALNSLVRRFQRSGLNRGTSMIITLAVVVVVGGLLISLVMPPFFDQLEQLILRVPLGYQNFISFLNRVTDNPPSWFPKRYIELPNLTRLAQQITPFVQKLLGNFFTFFSNSITNLLQILLVLVFSLMLLAEPQAYRKTFVRLFPSFYRQRADLILSKCEIVLLQWLGGSAITSLFVATLSWIGLMILGVQYVLAHALLAGVFNFIPNIGPTLSVIFPVSAALLDAPWKAVAVIILYIVIQNLESYWFSPLVMRHQVSLLPAITLTAQIFFATFFGVLGLILALPLTVVSKTWFEELLLVDLLDQWGDPSANDPIEDTEKKN